MSKKRRRIRHSNKKGEVAQLAAMLAPLEEQNRDAARQQGSTLTTGANHEPGAIVVDKQNVQLPPGIDQAGEEKSPLRIEPVVLVIVGVLLAYIAFIAWQVSKMPTQ